ncbi:MAG: hypothetical protein J4G13_09475 [Dehalococcoidia bacterium]|nr:hypothetical protein [Dehalococcoidia bacterium]
MGGEAATQTLNPQRFKLGSESERAYRLKWEAWEWLYCEARCRCIGLEVRLQGPWGSVVDVVGIGPNNVIYAVEVKASRADFTRDNHTEADIARLRQRQDALRRRMELANTPGYRSANGDRTRLEQEAERLKERLSTISTKFHDPRFLAIADYHYVMAPAGVVLAENLAPGWGLLEPGPREAVSAPEKAIRKNGGIVSNVLRAIARANSTTMMRAYGVRFGAEGARFPREDDCQVL